MKIIYSHVYFIKINATVNLKLTSMYTSIYKSCYCFILLYNNNQELDENL